MIPVDAGDLTEAEQALVKAFRTGDWADAGAEPVRAAVVAALLLQPAGAPDATVPALRLRAATVTGPLDVSYAEIAAPVHFDRCTFTDPPQLTGAQTRTLQFSDCELPGLDARLTTVRGDLRLSGSVVT